MRLDWQLEPALGCDWPCPALVLGLGACTSWKPAHAFRREASQKTRSSPATGGRHREAMTMKPHPSPTACTPEGFMFSPRSDASFFWPFFGPFRAPDLGRKETRAPGPNQSKLTAPRLQQHIRGLDQVLLPRFERLSCSDGHSAGQPFQLGQAWPTSKVKEGQHMFQGRLQRTLR